MGYGAKKSLKRDRLNVLFIMTDQQRVDFLSIYGNKVLNTPAMDRIGHEGAMFTNAYVPSAVCGPSRACFYTGRYIHAHRSRWNEVPLPITEKTAGHYFEEAGYRAAVIGKTHMYAEYPKPDFVKETCISSDKHHLSRLDSVGFEYVAGGAYSAGVNSEEYIGYLKSRGYPGEGYEIIRRAYYESDPTVEKMHEFALRAPARIKAEDSEAHFLTDKAIQFMKETQDKPWFLHLSFFRPHHPNRASFPYNEMYVAEKFPAPVRNEEERRHPLFGAFRKERNQHMGLAEDVAYCLHWRAVYAGLIKEIDDNLVRLFKFMDEHQLMQRTLIIFTSDHGELAGDHWFFEKEMCYWQSHKIPLLIRHPNMPGGQQVAQFVESVDILPTCLDAASIVIPPGIQGCSLLPFLAGDSPGAWRQATMAEWTFEYYNAPLKMGLEPEKCRAIMIRDEHYSYCHFNGLPDMLFDLTQDLNELHNIAEHPAHRDIIHLLKTKLIDWQLETWDPLPLRVDRGWPRKLGKGPVPAQMPYDFEA